ncbi:DUF4955 domain-containing protein [Photobacterium nomapromontoriensis]|uniref:DUF4955 domain-containing protein n=1 Tax=Photobacterium nomapromontoriensis TaxID=2910237 RepID=UPI003D1284B2
MMKYRSIVMAVGCLSLPIIASAENTSLYWENYVASRSQGSDLVDPNYVAQDGFIPPNFSYAGYQRGDVPLPDYSRYADYKIFNVTDYGAVANDGLSDKKAFQAMANAVNSYRQKSRQGIIFYVPEGDFIINDKSDMNSIDPNNLTHIRQQQIISIIGDNIILRGAGADKTRLLMKTHLLPETPKKMWSTPYIIQIGQDKDHFDTTVKTDVTQNIIGDSRFSLTVKDASAFKAGDYAEIRGVITHRERIDDAISPYKFEINKKTGKARWSELDKNLIKIEKHQIASVMGNSLTFTTPVGHTINADDNWTVTKIVPATGIGVEGITFAGSWSGYFIHHADALHDSGYSILRLTRATDSWIRDIEVTDFNQAIQIANSFNVTAQDIVLSGNPGHLALSILYGNNNLVQDVSDNANTWHAPGLSKYSSHNVNLRTTYSPLMGLDLHGAQSTDNLFDNIKGGCVQGHWGAAVKNQPNHLKGLYVWNAENTGKANDKLYFMSSNGMYGKLIMPHLIGLHGNPLNVNSQFDYMMNANQKGWAKYSSLPDRKQPQAHIESNGFPVYPQSLYDAQLKYRQARQ